MEKHLIIGLGNPGRDYRDTRHNVGFMLVDRFVQRHGLSLFTKKHGQALITLGTVAGRSVILAKPQTYMNLSGRAVGELMRFYQIPLTQLMVGVDDVDLPLGTLRLRGEGGSAGQKGMKSIIEQLGTEKFARTRIGIGRPPGQKAAADYVLRPFRDHEIDTMRTTLDDAVDALTTWLEHGIDIAMTRFNGAARETP